MCDRGEGESADGDSCIASCDGLFLWVQYNDDGLVAAKPLTIVRGELCSDVVGLAGS
jgi:hypothetical protein